MVGGCGDETTEDEASQLLGVRTAERCFVTILHDRKFADVHSKAGWQLQDFLLDAKLRVAVNTVALVCCCYLQITGRMMYNERQFGTIIFDFFIIFLATVKQ